MNPYVIAPLPTRGDIEAAARRLEGIVRRTPLLENQRVNERLGGRLLVKAEPLQVTGSFKFRGAYNFIAQLDLRRRNYGVVAWSSGNHAQGVAEAARLLNVAATIVMPSDAPALKIANTRASGADVVLYDRVRENREEIGLTLARERGATVIPPYDHPWIIAGQGTSGLEIAEQLEALGVTADAVAAPCSGGGLSSGIGLAFEGRPGRTKVYAAEPAGFDDMARSLAYGRRQQNAQRTGTICDALMAQQPGEQTFAIARRVLAGGLVASDDEARAAMALAFREFKLVVEPGGAVALAALLNGRIPVAGKTVVAVCSGGNVDPALFAETLQAVA